MPHANIHDRASIERVYPRALFENEANANSQAKADLLKGVTILSSPDAEGAFELQRASRHVGEQSKNAGDGGIFISPFAQEPITGVRADYPATAGSGAPAGDRDPYRRFIDRLVAEALRAKIDPSPGPGDARLRGLRQ